MKTDPLQPSAGLLIKLGSIIVHHDELRESEQALDHNAAIHDEAALHTVRNDPEVIAWLHQMTAMAFLPVRRNK